MTNPDHLAKQLPSSGDAADRDLDRMLGLLVPPAPSDMLRARLKRDFAVPAGQAAGTRRSVAFKGRTGGMAVAAALVLAVALGVLAPSSPPAPRSAMPLPLSASLTAPLYDDAMTYGRLADEDVADEDWADDALAPMLADAAPDSAAYMLAAYGMGANAGLVPASYETELVGLMPLE